eukprot:15447016-Heterocapsa_arctica.AAC.1
MEEQCGGRHDIGQRVAAKAVARADQRVLSAAVLEPPLSRGSPAPPTPRSGSCPQRLLHGRAGR